MCTETVSRIFKIKKSKETDSFLDTKDKSREEQKWSTGKIILILQVC